jgi:hypothetical protein
MRAFSAPNILTTLYAVRMGLVEVFLEVGVAISIQILMRAEPRVGTLRKTTLPFIGHAILIKIHRW